MMHKPHVIARMNRRLHGQYPRARGVHRAAGPTSRVPHVSVTTFRNSGRLRPSHRRTGRASREGYAFTSGAGRDPMFRTIEAVLASQSTRIGPGYDFGTVAADYKLL